MSDEMIPLCKCGDPLPSSPKMGEVLACPLCKRRYRGIGEGRVEAVIDVKTSVDEDGAEVMRFDDKGSTIKVNLREKRRQAEKRRSVAQARASGQTVPENIPSSDRPKAVRKKQEIPGGVMPMILFIIAFNAACFTALLVLFPSKDGFTQTPWGTKFEKPSIPWPEMLTLVLGHVLGFCGWAVYVHRLHKKQKEAKAREREQQAADDDDYGEEAV